MATSLLDALNDELMKSVGDNAENQAVTNWIDTGNPELNRIISGSYSGGIPFGRLLETFGESSTGKTAIATQCMVNAQKMGGVAIFIDWERSFDVRLAEGFGLNTQRPYWIYIKPKTWEQGNAAALRAIQLIRASKAIPEDAPILVVGDSIAAAVPESMLYDAKGKEREMDTYTMNDTTALARITSTTLKVVAAKAEEHNATFWYLNQLRLKPGVMFGDPRCLRGDVQIPFVDGTTATIREIVKNKISKEVWSYNETTGEIEPKFIVGWHDNGSIADADKHWVHIRATTPETKNGVSAVTATNDHKVLTREHGWINAEDVQVGNHLVTHKQKTFTGLAKEFIGAVISFDSHISQVSPERQKASLVIRDNNDPEYAKWKVEKLSKHLRFATRSLDGGLYVKYESNFTNELLDLKAVARTPLDAIGKKWTALQLAIAIMDDGYYERDRYQVSFKRLKGDSETLDAILDAWYENFGITGSVRYGQGRIDIDAGSSRTVAELIAEYVPDCMKRKLPDDLHGRYVEFELGEPKGLTETAYAIVTEVRTGGKKLDTRMYDITIEDNHNFLAGNKDNGFIVHNCTPGGKAMEFYSSVRLALGRQKIMDKSADGDKEFVGQNITVQTVKNKLTRPFQECNLRLMYDEIGCATFDHVAAILDLLISKGWIEYSKPRVTWTDGKKYFVKDLVKKLNEESDGLEQLKVFLPKFAKDSAE